MPVTKQTYTAVAPWSPTSLAQAFEDAFIGAGLMTDWYDEFTNGGFEHRILEIVYDGTKAYGKAYYWFLFNGQEVFYSVATGWNTTTNAPTGTVLFDFINASTTVASNHLRFAQLNSLSSTTVTRYTSQADADFTWFYVRCGTVNFDFHISKTAPNGWIDLNKLAWHPLMHVKPEVSGSSGFMSFIYGPIRLRRSVVGGNGYREGNAFLSYGNNSGAVQQAGSWGRARTHIYQFIGNSNNYYATNNQIEFSGIHPVTLPSGFNNANPAFSTDVNPIWSGLPLSLYSPAVLPSDFGIAGHLTSNTMATFDQYVVTPSTEIYDIIRVANPDASDRYAAPLFLARVV